MSMKMARMILLAFGWATIGLGWAAESSAAKGEPLREYRSIWVDSWNRGILNAVECDELIQTCRDNHVNMVMVEIRKVGDAYYKSNLEPRATNISGGGDFDPLGYLIKIAHDTSGGKKRVEVHAWFVAHRITTGETLDPRHILSRHPEYAMLKADGDPYAGGNRYLDPGHPGAVDHNVAVIVDCLKHYAIDGINLDYIRYPEYEGQWGYNPVSVARFNAFTGKSGQPSASDPAWDAWRRECVTLEVKKIYVKSLMVDPGVVLTADTINWGFDYGNYENSRAYCDAFQDWVDWLRQGIIDYNALMNYSRTRDRYEGWTKLSLANDAARGSIIGIGAYLQPTVEASLDQLRFARAQGAAGLNIYDWYSEVNAASPATRAEFYAALKADLFSQWADPPVHTWKTHPTTGIFEGTLTAGGAPVDHGTVKVEGLSSASTVTDGSGWYALLGVPPGSHTLRFSKAGHPDALVPASLSAAGKIITLNADLAAGKAQSQKR